MLPQQQLSILSDIILKTEHILGICRVRIIPGAVINIIYTLLSIVDLSQGSSGRNLPAKGRSF